MHDTSAAGHRDHWPGIIFLIHFTHALVFARMYPHNLYDPDLLAYFVYFRNWRQHYMVLHGISYFTHPKPLLIFTLGTLANVPLAFVCSALISGLLGSLLYLVGRQFFGRTTAFWFAVISLLDPFKWVLTLKSSADLYIAVFLFATIYFVARERSLTASVCLLLSALVKPVTLPCTLQFLATERRTAKSWLCFSLPFLALPLTLLSNQALLGSPFGSGTFLKEFASLRDGMTVGPAEVLHYAVWTQLVKNRFISTAPFGFVGLFVWVAADRRRLTSPLLLVPLLFLVGYFLLSFPSAYMPFFRFYWPLEVWFLGFILFGIVESAQRLSLGRRSLRNALLGILLFFLANDYMIRQLTYRDDFGIPFERSMTFVSAARAALQHERSDDQQILVPLAFLPYFMWELDIRSRADLVLTAEQASQNPPTAPPEWVLDVPKIYASDAGREFAENLIAQGHYKVQFAQEEGALLRRVHEPPAKDSP